MTDDKTERAETARTLLEAVLGDFAECRLGDDKGRCGCPVVAVIPPNGDVRFVALDPEGCKRGLGNLPPVERHFYEKRIRLVDLPPEVVKFIKVWFGE